MPQRLEEELVFKDQELLELRRELNVHELKIQQLQVCVSFTLHIPTPFSYSILELHQFGICGRPIPPCYMGPEIALFSCQEVGEEKRGFSLHGIKGDFGIPTIHSCLLSTFAFTTTATETVSHMHAL